MSKLSKLGETWQRNKERKDFSISFSHQQSLSTEILIPGVRGSQLGRVQLLADIWARARVLTMAHYPPACWLCFEIYLYPLRGQTRANARVASPHLASRRGSQLSVENFSWLWGHVTCGWLCAVTWIMCSQCAAQCCNVAFDTGFSCQVVQLNTINHHQRTWRRRFQWM